MDKLTRPTSTPLIHNGCGQHALAILTERDSMEFLRFANIRNGQHHGTPLFRIFDALHDLGIQFTTRYMANTRVRMADYLPLRGRGMLVVSSGRRRTHAIAYSGKLVCDVNTDMRWMWVYDHPLAHRKTMYDIRIEEA